MALVSKGISNLIGGVSQQPDSTRFDNQCDVQDNAYPSVLDGLTKRMPTEHVANLDSSTPGDAEDYFIHTINRDATERYVITIKANESGSTLKVHSISGAAKTVNDAGGSAVDATDLAYFNMVDPATGSPSALHTADTNLRALTIADYTFFVNRTKTVAMDSTLGTNRNPEALVFVKQGDYSTKYSYTVVHSGASTPRTHTSADGDVVADRALIATDYIADQLDASITNFNVSRSGSVIWLQSTSTTDFTIDGFDGLGDTAMVIIKDEVQHLTDLPTTAPHGFEVRIVGDATDTRDDYYVQFVADDGVFGSGYWQEFRQKNIKYKFDASTMPHVLVRQADGSFVFGPCDGSHATLPTWGERNAGDEVSNADPTFVGTTINDIFFFKNRLGLLGDENVIMSETSEFFNFWRTTVTDLMDTDPIDVASTHNTVSILQSAIPFARQLVLFSEQTQFVLQGSSPLSPKTVAMTKTTNYESISDVRPVTIGSSIYFGFTRGSFSGIRQYYISTDTAETLFDAADISGQVPQYINGSIRDMAGSSHEDILFVLANGDRTSLYAYKFFDQSGERLQSSWSRFKFSSNDTILGIEFIDTTLFLVVKRADGIYLDKMRMESGLVDTGVEYRTLLDRRVDQAAATPSYSSGTGNTTITMPYKAYTNSTIEVITKAGKRIPVATQTNDSNQIVVAEDLSSTTYWLGEKYEMVYEFSDVVMREPTQGGGDVAIAEGRVQVRYLTLTYSESGFFKVVVTPDYRDTSTHPFTGRILGSGANKLGSVPLETGTFRIPVYSQADQVKIEAKNDTPLPCSLMSAEYEISLNARSQRYS